MGKKDLLTIGEMAKELQVSSKTLRIYEEHGLVTPVSRGENGYRYYSFAQRDSINKVLQLRKMGFSIAEITELIGQRPDLDESFLVSYFEKKVLSHKQSIDHIEEQVRKIDQILKKMKKVSQRELNSEERRFVLKQFDCVSLFVCGTHGLEKTGEKIRQHMKTAGVEASVIQWKPDGELPPKPYIALISESQLLSEEASHLRPDVVVVKEVSQPSEEVFAAYEKFFENAGAHLTSALNADDRVVVEMTRRSERIRKGRTFYFSKNKGLEEQIEKIGGLVSSGREMKIFGFNLAGNQTYHLHEILSQEEETSLMASLVAVMDIGIPPERIFGDSGTNAVDSI